MNPIQRQIARLWLPSSQGEAQGGSPLGQKNYSRQQNPLGYIGDSRQRPAPAAAEQNELWSVDCKYNGFVKS
jgi:hypothetical protein